MRYTIHAFTALCLMLTFAQPSQAGPLKWAGRNVQRNEALTQNDTVPSGGSNDHNQGTGSLQDKSPQDEVTTPEFITLSSTIDIPASVIDNARKAAATADDEIVVEPVEDILPTEPPLQGITSVTTETTADVAVSTSLSDGEKQPTSIAIDTSGALSTAATTASTSESAETSASFETGSGASSAAPISEPEQSTTGFGTTEVSTGSSTFATVISSTSRSDVTLPETTAALSTFNETTIAETTLAETTLAETTLAETTLAETTLAETTIVPDLTSTRSRNFTFTRGDGFRTIPDITTPETTLLPESTTSSSSAAGTTKSESSTSVLSSAQFSTGLDTEKPDLPVRTTTSTSTSSDLYSEPAQETTTSSSGLGISTAPVETLPETTETTSASTTSLTTSITTAPSSAPTSDLEAARLLNEYYATFDASTPCTGATLACISGQVAQCNGETFVLAPCRNAADRCFALPSEQQGAGTVVVCRAPAQAGEILGMDFDEDGKLLGGGGAGGDDEETTTTRKTRTSTVTKTKTEGTVVKEPTSTGVPDDVPTSTTSSSTSPEEPTTTSSSALEPTSTTTSIEVPPTTSVESPPSSFIQPPSSFTSNVFTQTIEPPSDEAPPTAPTSTSTPPPPPSDDNGDDEDLPPIVVEPVTDEPTASVADQSSNSAQSTATQTVGGIPTVSLFFTMTLTETETETQTVTEKLRETKTVTLIVSED